jgi:hypothetical protein
LGYEPNELPDCSTPRQEVLYVNTHIPLGQTQRRRCGNPDRTSAPAAASSAGRQFPAQLPAFTFQRLSLLAGSWKLSV